MGVLVGEGAGPTWETGPHYTEVELGNDANGSGPWGWGQTNAGALEGTDALPTTFSASIKIYIDNVGSSSLYKIARTYVTEEKHSQSDLFIEWHGANYWNNDTNPITGLEVAAAGGGTIASGTCSLYGMN